jgi:putative OPT family oligopeptide transporter
VRYLGVGAMLTGGVVTLWRLRIRITAAIVDSIRVVRSTQVVATAREDTDLSPRAVLTAVALCIPVIFAICLGLSGQIALSAALAILLTLICFFATSIAGYLTGIVGASNNPVSGVTVIVLLAVALFLKMVGVSQTVGPQLAILSGAIVCTAAAMAGDSTHDLATGYYVGATPRSLEIGVLVGAIASSFLMAPILNLLIAGYGIAGTVTARAGALAAPQAFLMAKVTEGVFHGGLPLGTIATGAALAAILGFSDRYLERAGSSWRTPIMPVAIGLYLPFGLSVTIFLGALIHSIFGSEKADESGPGILLAAGLVAGEALMGVASGAIVTAGIRLPLF